MATKKRRGNVGTPKSLRTRDPMKRDLMQPKYKQRVVPDKTKGLHRKRKHTRGTEE